MSNQLISGIGYSLDKPVYVMIDDVNPDDRSAYNSVLLEYAILIKMLHIGYSLLKLNPKSTLKIDRPDRVSYIENTDISSIWSLTRMLFESYLVMSYMSNIKLEKSVVQARKILYLYHNSKDRLKGLEGISENEKLYKEKTEIMNRAVCCLKELRENSYWKSIQSKDEKKLFLKKGFFLTPNEMAFESGIHLDLFKQFYQISSWHIHCKPQGLAHLMTSEENRRKLYTACYQDSFSIIYLALCHYCRICQKLIPTMDYQFTLRCNRFANKWKQIQL